MTTLSSTIQIYDRFSGPLKNYMSALQNAGKAADGLKSSMNMPTGKFSGVGKELDGLGSKAQKTGGLFKNMLGANLVSSAAIAGISAITRGVGEITSALSSSSATWKTFQGNMEQLGKSPQQIGAAKQAMQDYATKTIYSASDMASTYAQLAAVGTKNTGQLVKGFGGLAAASENPAQAMKTLSQQATQMAAKPMVQWADFKLMLEQSPAGMAAVAKSMGISTGQLIKNIQNGTVKTQDFFDAIQKTGNNANFTKMATQFKTVGQAADGLKETLVNALQPAFDKVSQIGINAISGLSNIIGKIDFTALADKVIGIFTTIGNTIKSFWNTLKGTGAITALTSAFDTLKSGLSYVVAMLNQGGNGMNTVKTAAQTLGAVLKVAASAISAFGVWLLSLDPSQIQAIATAAKIAVGAFIGFKIAVSTFKALSTAAGAVKTALNFGSVIAQSVAKLFGLATAQTATALTAAPMAAGETAVGAAASVSAGQILAMGAAILMVGAGILIAAAGMYVLVQSALALAAGGWPAVGALVALTAVIALFAVGLAILGPALTAGAIGMLAFGVAILLVSAGITLASFGMSMLASQLPIIAAYGMMAAAGMLAIGLAAIVLGAGALVAGAGLLVMSVGMLVVSAAALIAAAAAVVLGAGLLVLAAGIMGVTVAVAAFIAVISAAIAGIAGLVSAAASAMSGFVGAISNGVKSAVGAMKSAAGGLIDAVSNIDLGSAGSAIMNGFLGGLKSAWGAVKNFVGGIAGWIKAHKGPISYDAKLLIPAGNAIMGGFGDALDNSFRNVKSSVASYAGQVSDMFSGQSVPVTLNGSPLTSTLSSDGLTGTTTNNTQSNQNVTYSFGAGSIVLQSAGNGETGEQLLEKFATALRSASNRSLANG
ncbi:tape measure protein [Weissella soli]|uniref:tape measure protein n=1 Tax=Weissella soli TaxID=155866 RepID=UPI003EF31415